MDKTAVEGNCGKFNSVSEGAMTEKSSRRESVAAEGNAKVVPEVGMEFDTPIAAHQFYNNYANLCGFGTKIKSSNYVSRTKELRRMVFSCTKEGYKQKNENIKNPRPETREGCLAMMLIRKKLDSEKWVVTKVVTEHTHLLNPTKAFLHPSHMDPNPTVKKRSPLYHEAGHKTNGHTPVLPKQNVAIAHAGFLGSDLRNYVDYGRRLAVREGDVQTILNLFSFLQMRNTSFYYAMDVSADGRLRNVFWVDAKAKVSYSCFSDVITFDNTYLKGKYGMPFVSFVGMNHHGEYILLGCGFLADETKETYSWLFRAWLQAVSNRPPISIITEHCWSVQAAIGEVFPGVRHRIWQCHILEKVPEKLGPLGTDAIFLKRFHSCVYDSLRIEEFKRNWLEIMQDYKLTDNEWLNELYKDRGRWVPVYLKGTFFAGMSRTHQIESMDAFFDGIMHPKTCLREFVVQYELARENQCEKEVQADFNSFHMKPPLKTKSVFEKDAANVYTREIFSKFQDEICGMPNCTTRLIQEDGPIATYIVIEIEEGDDGTRNVKEYEVKFDVSDTKVHCICRLFEFEGYLCKHALVVLVNSGVNQIPSHYILSRWRKDAKRILAEAGGLVDGGLWRERYNDLCDRSNKFIQDAALTGHTYAVALDALDEAWNKVRQAHDSLSKAPNLVVGSMGIFPFHDTATFHLVTDPCTVSVNRVGEISSTGISLDQNVSEGHERNSNPSPITCQTGVGAGIILTPQ